MEEADALADRAGIMATRMLALGTTDYLRKKHGDAYYVHLITTTAPHTPPEHMERIKTWVAAHFASAEIEEKTYHGQLRFSIPARPAAAVAPAAAATSPQLPRAEIGPAGTMPASPLQARSSISALFNLLERHKHELGLEYYSVSQTTLDQVFLTIIGKHNVEEENQRAAPPKKRWWRRFF
jgi:ABC-type multidrug transport system ATPase subunit